MNDVDRSSQHAQAVSGPAARQVARPAPQDAEQTLRSSDRLGRTMSPALRDAIFPEQRAAAAAVVNPKPEVAKRMRQLNDIHVGRRRIIAKTQRLGANRTDAGVLSRVAGLVQRIFSTPATEVSAAGTAVFPEADRATSSARIVAIADRELAERAHDLTHLTYGRTKARRVIRAVKCTATAVLAQDPLAQRKAALAVQVYCALGQQARSTTTIRPARATVVLPARPLQIGDAITQTLARHPDLCARVQGIDRVTGALRTVSVGDAKAMAAIRPKRLLVSKADGRAAGRGEIAGVSADLALRLAGGVRISSRVAGLRRATILPV